MNGTNVCNGCPNELDDCYPRNGTCDAYCGSENNQVILE